MTGLFSTPHPIDTDVDISSVAFWAQDFAQRDLAFARLRADAPVSWHPPLETPGLPRRFREAGFWAVTKASDVALVSRRHDAFSSELGQVSARPTPFRIERNMLVLDPPDHTRYRRLVGNAFAARGAAKLEASVARHARQVVMRAALAEEFDFVTAIASQLPLRTLSDLLGVPEGERTRFALAADAYTNTGVPALPAPQLRAYLEGQSASLRGLIADLIHERRQRPTDDLLSRLAAAGSNEGGLSDSEILSAVLLLIVAGDDTTKQALTLAFLALQDNPEQKDWLLADYDNRFDTAFDELVRFTSPVLSFARTATVDVELGGRSIAAGDKVVLFYCSANRDEALFAEPHTLDLARNPNRHSAFGGGGVHFCLGSAVARVQIKTLFKELFTRMPNLRAGSPRFRFSEFVHAVDALPTERGRRG